jgi:hypothetical protein
MEFKITYRDINNWYYKAVSTQIKVNGIVKEFVYGKSPEGDGLEIYQGENYIVHSKDRSRSWRYTEPSIPKCHQAIYETLKKEWSTIKDWGKPNIN